MAASQLGLYNAALAHLGERALSSLSEAREPRRKLDAVWDDCRNYCLEQGLWKFAVRTIKAQNSNSVTPQFGWGFAFDKPADWVRTAVVSSVPELTPPLGKYNDEQAYLFCDFDTVYWAYVSNDADYGLNLGRWPQTFGEYVAVRLAVKIVRGTTQSDTDLQTLIKLETKYRVDARSKDAMNEPTKYPPQGTWVTSRQRRGGPGGNSSAGWLGGDW